MPKRISVFVPFALVTYDENPAGAKLEAGLSKGYGRYRTRTCDLTGVIRAF